MALIFSLLILLSAFSSFGGALAAWRRRTQPGAIPLMAIGLLAGLWALLYGLELSSQSLPAKIFWASLKYPAITLIPIAAASFFLRFSGWTNWPSRRLLAALLIIPVATNLLIFTNASHHLFWLESHLAHFPTYSVYEATHGPIFWVHVIYSYTLMVTSLGISLSNLAHLGQAYRRQILSLTVGLSIPLLVNLFNLAGIQLFPSLDLSPIAIGLSSLIFLFSTGTDSLLNVLPLAYASLIEQMRDGVLVLDTHGRIVEVNPAAGHILNLPRPALIGRRLGEIDHPALSFMRPSQGRNTVLKEMMVGEPPNTTWYELRISPLASPNDPMIGHMLIWHNITERKQIEAGLRFASTHDPLTGLYNRMFFEEEFDRTRAGRAWPVTIIVADLDNLKRTNDSLGHATGDNLIRRAADLLRQALRAGDLIARIGGDEFAMLIPSCNEAGAEIVIQRLNQTISVYNTAQPELPVEISLGSATAYDGTQLESAMHQADAQMYANKSQRKASD